MKKILCLSLISSGLLSAQARPHLACVIPPPSVTNAFPIYASHTDESKNTHIMVAVIPLPNGGCLADNRPFWVPHIAAQATSVTPVVTGSLDTTFNALYTVIAPFYDYFPGGPPATQSNPATVQPATPPHPLMIFVDGFGTGLIAVDLAALTFTSQVAAIPMGAGPLAIRPSSAGSSNEIWVAEYGAVAVVDLAGKTVAANISIPSIPVAVAPAGIVFTPDGATAFEAFGYGSPDSSGNNGALIVMNAATRTVSATLPLKIQPTAVLMAPDDSTVYILSASGTLTYYDVLSGTADLTVSTYAPGSNAGYVGASSVAIHPDGTRLFWNVGVYLVTFDLATHRVTNQFNSGLSTSVSHIFSLSQDGEFVFFSGLDGNVAILDTFDGTVVATFSNMGFPTSVFGGPPIAP
jgi:DNA-binding beta-propeller fold protein YncE